MRRAVFAVVVLLVLASVTRAQQSLIDSDFGQHDALVEVQRERVQGRLPEGWSDNSEWAQVWARYVPMQQEGRSFVRVDVTRIDSGRCQLAHYLPRAAEETFYRLTLVARATTGVSVDIQVRQSPEPYKVMYSIRPNLGGGWREQTIEFRTDGLDSDIGLFICVEGVGPLDLAKVQLSAMSRSELAKDLSERYAHLRGKNLVRASRFPLGLPSGWTLDSSQSDGDEVVVTADPQTIGPSGAAALRITGTRSFDLYSAPFAAPLATEPHVASLYMRGRGRGTLSVLGDMRQLAQVPYELDGQDWQRISVPFTPVLLGRYHALRISGEGEVWIDALQVETGSEPRPYGGQEAYEVALAVSSPAKVQFDDEPAAITLRITPPPPASLRIRTSVTNAYGDSSEAGIEQDKPNQAQLRYDVFDKRPLGSHRVEAWLEDEAGRRVSPVEEIVVHRLRRPRYWGADAPDSPFGVHTNATNRHIETAKAIGVNWTRLHDAGTTYIGWRHIEPQRGQWEFQDAPLKRYRDGGLKVLGAFSTTPDWASLMDRPRNGYFDQFWQPRNLDEFRSYVRTVAERYRGTIDAYDVWNEPWFPQWWAASYDPSRPGERGYRHSADPAGDYVALCRAAYETAKSVDASITIVGLNTTNHPADGQAYGGTNWTRDVLAAGGLEACDVAGYHQYLSSLAGWPGDEVTSGFTDAVGQVRAAAPDKPIWMTEGNAIRDTIGNGLYLHTVLGRNEENVTRASVMLVRHIVAMLSQGVRKEFLYSMHSHTHFGRPDTWKTLVCEDGSLHPCGAAHSALAWLIEDTRFVRNVPLAPGVWAHLFQTPDGARSVAVVLHDAERRAYALPDVGPSAQWSDLYGNPLSSGEALGWGPAYASGPVTADALQRLIEAAP